MIITQLPNTSAYFIGSANACKILGPSLPEIPILELNDSCICDFIECKYIEKIFVSPGNEYWKNDMSEFLFKRFVTADTVDIELYLGETKVADLNTNTYGTFFNGFASGSTEQQIYVGYLIDWELVYGAFGAGVYQVKAQLNIIGVSTEFESRQFNVCIYSDLAADGTVRIESSQNGNIIGNQFDFSGLDWYQSVRIPGRFGNPTPIYENDRYVTETRKVRQIKDKMSREWTLNTKKIDYEVANKLIYNKLLANEILITDYSLKAESIWRRIGVFPSEVSKSELTNTPNKTYSITFVDNKDYFIKRNF